MSFRVTRWRSRGYLDWVAQLPCCHCGKNAHDPHHLKGENIGGTALTAPDLATMPLCRKCHNLVHKNPDDFPQARWMSETLNLAFFEGVLLGPSNIRTAFAVFGHAGPLIDTIRWSESQALDAYDDTHTGSNKKAHRLTVTWDD